MVDQIRQGRPLGGHRPWRINGAGLRLARIRAELSQDELGAMLGCSGATVGRWEAGTSTPSRAVLNTVAGILNVPEGSLMEEDAEVVDADEEGT